MAEDSDTQSIIEHESTDECLNLEQCSSLADETNDNKYKTLLRSIQQFSTTDDVQPPDINTNLITQFFRIFWNRSKALKYAKLFIGTTIELARRFGAAEVVSQFLDDLKHPNEQYRRMVMKTIDHHIEGLIGGIFWAFQEQTTADTAISNAFVTIVNSLSKRIQQYIPEICGIILWRLESTSPEVRQQAADLIIGIAGVLKECREEKLIVFLANWLYEHSCEKQPKMVMNSTVGALQAIANIVRIDNMTPRIKNFLLRYTFQHKSNR